MELERQHHVLVICHQAVARCLLAYFTEVDKGTLFTQLSFSPPARVPFLRQFARYPLDDDNLGLDEKVLMRSRPPHGLCYPRFARVSLVSRALSGAACLLYHTYTNRKMTRQLWAM